MEHFDEIWDALAAKGFCDARGGAEYQRVRAAWFKFGYFNLLWQFIIDSSNATGRADDARAHMNDAPTE